MIREGTQRTDASAPVTTGLTRAHQPHFRNVPQPTRCPPFTLILPTFNEQEGIRQTLDHVRQHLDSAECEYEIIVVNDGSTDGTRVILNSIDGIRIIDHGRNRGYGAALKTGIRHARHPLIVITDADGTYPNECIPDLVAMTSEADMVVGARTGEDVKYPWIRRVPKWFLIRFAQWMAGQRIPDLNSGLRVFQKSIAERFLHLLPDTFSFTTTITLAMLANNYIVRYEPINYRRRMGRSKIKPVSDTLRFVQLILRTGIFFAPLRIFLPVSCAFFAGFLVTFCRDLFIRRDLTERTLLLFVAATQLGMFSLLADMIARRNKAP